MASSVSAEKLVILEWSGGTFVTVYAAGRVKSGGITGLTFDSTKGEPNVGCSGKLLEALLARIFNAWKGTHSGRLKSKPRTVKSWPMARVE